MTSKTNCLLPNKWFYLKFNGRASERGQTDEHVVHVAPGMVDLWSSCIQHPRTHPSPDSCQQGRERLQDIVELVDHIQHLKVGKHVLPSRPKSHGSPEDDICWDFACSALVRSHGAHEVGKRHNTVTQ